MIKKELKEYLESKFNTVLENSKDKDIIENNKINLDIQVNSIDDKVYVWVSEFVCKNKKGDILYFVYYGKKNTTLIYDDVKKNICIRLANNVTQRYQYEAFLKKVKHDLNKSNSYIIFFSCDKVIFPIKNPKNRIYVVNEETIDSYLNKFYDFN